MRESEKYIADVLKNLGVGLVVGSIVSTFTVKEPSLVAFLWLIYGAILIVEGYLFTKGVEK